MKRLLLILLSLLPLTSFGDDFQKVTPLYKVSDALSLNGTWKFKYIEGNTCGADTLFYTPGYDLSGWSDVKVPLSPEFQGFHHPKYGWRHACVMLYSRDFDVPANASDRRTFIRFDGILSAYELYVNGHYAGSWRSAWQAASFEVTDLVKPGHNTLSVRVQGEVTFLSDLDRNDNWQIRGITRNVSLFTTPKDYIEDYQIVTKVLGGSSVSIKAELNGEADGIETTLYDAEGKVVGQAVASFTQTAPLLPYNSNGVPARKLWSDEAPATPQPQGLRTAQAVIAVPDPKLWTAETPYLYRAELRLMRAGKPIQTLSSKVGLRELTIDGNVLKLNGSPLKLKGVNHHDLEPLTGPTVTEEGLLKDLMLMKKGNINFIRTCHYPPDVRKIELCDSLGIYLTDEMPYGFGRIESWRPEMEQYFVERANALVRRDQNHPSVIMWNIGNENRIMHHSIKAGRIVKALDPSRLLTYAGTGERDMLPDFVDIYTCHYPNAGTVNAYHGPWPMINTEYAHSLGLGQCLIEDIWKAMFENPASAGGAIWHFHDQGLLFHYDTPVDTTRLCMGDIWMDPHTVMEATLEGVDGIVYADRTPQSEYWYTRNAYSPVKIVERTLSASDQALTVYNQYDFLNISRLSGQCALLRNGKVTAQAPLSIDCAPHATVKVPLPLSLPSVLSDNVWTLRLTFDDPQYGPIYEHIIRLSPKLDLSKGLDNAESKPRFKSGIFGSKAFGYEIGSQTFSLSVGGVKVIEEGILPRAGREPSMADSTVLKFNDPFKFEKNYFWNPYVLHASEAKVSGSTTPQGYEFTTEGTYPRLGSELFLGEDRIEGRVDQSIDQTGRMNVRFTMTPKDATGMFLNAGVSLILAPSMDNVSWIGYGPFTSTPDRCAGDAYRVWRMKKGDLEFNGNRHGVSIAVVTDDAGNGLALLCDEADVAFEVKNGRIILSYNSLVAGVGGKKLLPAVHFWANQVKDFGGEFSIIPLRAGAWPSRLVDLIGYPDPSRPVNNPFYYSYDTSK